MFPQCQQHTRRFVQMTCRQRLGESQAIATVLGVFQHGAAQSRDRRFRIPTTRGPLRRVKPSSRLPAVQCLVAVSDGARAKNDATVTPTSTVKSTALCGRTATIVECHMTGNDRLSINRRRPNRAMHPSIARTLE